VLIVQYVCVSVAEHSTQLTEQQQVSAAFRGAANGNAENAPKPQQRQVPQRTPQFPHTLVTRCPPDGPRCPAGLRPCGPLPGARAGAPRAGEK